eukprot:CAMPEP_0172486042 /NCGR_PEP_ID=MMETSP1066-20121228/14415_1 /TAXON_ID=671091 /ORGANISM="Coscinodiscus wailesii, Strain CCMP2513" /LENGTH=185 /DNA_ID=CAMNT_0013251733 /DNA_START=149 /DNA_END=707 /DNA_ORIENTATION=+
MYDDVKQSAVLVYKSISTKTAKARRALKRNVLSPVSSSRACKTIQIIVSCCRRWFFGLLVSRHNDSSGREDDEDGDNLNDGGNNNTGRVHRVNAKYPARNKDCGNSANSNIITNPPKNTEFSKQWFFEYATAAIQNNADFETPGRHIKKNARETLRSSRQNITNASSCPSTSISRYDDYNDDKEK